MKRNKKVKKTNPVEQSSDGSDTEDMPPPQTMKKVKITRKTRNTISEVSSDSEDKSELKQPMKNSKKKTVESSYCTKVAGSSHNSDTTVKSLLPENASQIVKKRITKRASSTTEPADNSDSEDVPQKSKKKGKKVHKTEEPTSNDSDTTVKSLLPENSSQIVKKSITKRASSSTTEPAENSDSGDVPQKSKKKGKKVHKTEEPTSNDSDSGDVPQKSKKKGKKVHKTEEPTSNDSDTTVKSLLPENVSKIVKKINTKRASSATEPADNSDSGDVPQKSKKKGKKVHKTEEPTSNDSDTTVKSLLSENVSQIVKKRITKRTSSTTQPADNSDSGDLPQKSKKKGKKVHKTEEPTSNDSDTTVKSLLSENVSQIAKKRMTKRTSSTTQPAANSDSEDVPQKSKKKGKKVHKTEEPTSNDPDESEDIDGDDNSEAIRQEMDLRLLDLISDESENDDDEETTKHKEYLDHLSRVDPDFYKFLEEHNTELHVFRDRDFVLDVNEEDDDDKSGGSGSGQNDKEHVPGDLHGSSDESDSETEGTLPKGITTVNLKMVRELEIELQKSTIKLGTITKSMKFFIAAIDMLLMAGRDGEFMILETPVFTAVLDMCAEHFPNAIGRYLGFETSGKDPQKCKNFVKIKSNLIQYLSSLVDFLHAFIPEDMLCPMLTHLHQLSAYLACFSKLSKKAIKQLLPLWCSRIRQIRILSFRCIFRITRNLEETLLGPVVKVMFMGYMVNCKLVNPTTWPSIKFTRRALVETCKMNLDLSYPHVCLYVKQLGIHLRNAVVVPKLEHEELVLNWQYINLLHLCADLVSETLYHSGMNSLNYTLVMIISYTIKLGSTPQYYPLRFFLIELLMKMQEKNGIFITIKPFFMDVITKFEINKEHTTESTEPMDFSCIIRLSESQMNESGFKDAVVKRLYALLLEYTASLSYKICFPEYCTILIIYMEILVDECKNPNHKEKIKELLDKIVENVDYMNKKRDTFEGSFANISHILPWQDKIKEEGTPLLTLYKNWKEQNNA